MQHPRYVMFDQARNTVHEIMRERAPRPPLLHQPSWLALVLLLAAFNLIAIATP